MVKPLGGGGASLLWGASRAVPLFFELSLAIS
jgi:hypothetical protein